MVSMYFYNLNLCWIVQVELIWFPKGDSTSDNQPKEWAVKSLATVKKITCDYKKITCDYKKITCDYFLLALLAIDLKML